MKEGANLEGKETGTVSRASKKPVWQAFDHVLKISSNAEGAKA